MFSSESNHVLALFIIFWQIEPQHSYKKEYIYLSKLCSDSIRIIKYKFCYYLVVNMELVRKEKCRAGSKGAISF